MSKSVRLQLPWPPSVNHYWIHRVIAGKGRKPFVSVAIGSKGKEFRKAVSAYVQGRWPKLKPSQRRVAVTIVATMPDKRKRDLDNILKATKDALSHAGFWEDDSQVDDLRVIRGKVQAPGGLDITVTEIPDSTPVERGLFDA